MSLIDISDPKTLGIIIGVCVLLFILYIVLSVVNGILFVPRCIWRIVKHLYKCLKKICFHNDDDDYYDAEDRKSFF